MRCSWGWVILWRSIKSTAIKTFYAFTVRVAEFARLKTLTIFLHAVRALAGAALLRFGWTGLAFPSDHFPHKGVRVLAEDMLNGLMPKFLFIRH